MTQLILRIINLNRNQKLKIANKKIAVYKDY